MKPGEIKITFTVVAADNAATEKLARDIISRMSLLDGVSLENMTRYNTGGLIPSIDSISFSRGINYDALHEPGYAAARKHKPPFLTEYSHPDGTIDLYGICTKADRRHERFDGKQIDVEIDVPDLQDYMRMPLRQPLPADATPAERAAWMIEAQLKGAESEFNRLQTVMASTKGILSYKDITALHGLSIALGNLRKAHVANSVQAGKSQKEVAEANDISTARVSQIVKEVGFPEEYLSRKIGDNVAKLLLKAPEKDEDPVISETALVQTTEGTSELQHLLEMGFPLATTEEMLGADKEIMTPASLAKAGILPQSWIKTPVPPCSFYSELLDRYDLMLKEDIKLPETGYQSAQHLRGMITQMHFDMSQSLTKKHRWLGYIQGVMCVYGLIDVDTERDWTRGLFRGA